ncbi:MAG: hypothetical protein Q8Q06_03755 [bacterium]|nr:hypothetical protein [bacterium]
MKNQTIEINSAIRGWTKGKLNPRSSFYTGRGPNIGDLNSWMLEAIYQGIKTEVGEGPARNFVQFVYDLKDLSASAFLQAFEQFWYGGCEVTTEPQREGTGNQLTGHDEDELFAEGWGLIGHALGGSRLSQDKVEALSCSLKLEFIEKHKKEIVGYTNRRIGKTYFGY